MRKKIVAGNWKMNSNLTDGTKLFQQVSDYCNHLPSNQLTVIIAPPFTHLHPFSNIKNSGISLAAQNCSAEPNGAYTGEVSASIVFSSGAKYVVIGHSERRKYFGETNELLKKKIDLALIAGLHPIYCCGELLEERKQNKHFETVTNQMEDALFNLDETQIGKIIVAYEPVWAIGTGQTATPLQAQEMHELIRAALHQRYGVEIANSISIIYGGSCNSQNAPALFAMQDIDGGLIGGASLVAPDFINIIDASINCESS